ncbi:MAG: hypothetical protein ACRDE5_19140, partial [Ginsengibacter sp.]
ISWLVHPVPEDVKGILIKYDDGIFSDRYDFETKKRKYREGHIILGWKFMERSDKNKKSILCNQPERSKQEDLVFKEPDFQKMKSENPRLHAKYLAAQEALRCGALNIVETQ